MNRYKKLEEQIGVTFRDATLLDTAFVHRSYINEHREEGRVQNERLEFLGDAVLELVVTEYLYGHFPTKAEGELTAFRSALVKGRHLAEIADSLDLGLYLYLSHGEEKSGGRKKHYILANTLEALIGAMYLDQGFSVAHDFVSRFILTRLSDIVENELHVDAKSKLQEITQERFGVTPIYKLMEESGPDHDKTFTMAVCINDEVLGQGQGSSKQKAEQKAAIDALEKKGW
ncbi:MAG: ribonuclease III [Patescibacteria group bacterium]